MHLTTSVDYTMLRLMKKILLCLFLICATIPLFSQNGYWEESKGPYGGGDFQITKTNTGKLYATDGPKHTYRSDDNGLSWERLPDLGAPFPDSLDKTVSIGNAGTIFIDLNNDNTSANTFYKSSDDGQNWTLLNNSVIGADKGITSVTETSTGTLLGNQNNLKTWRSTDAGQTWVLAINDGGRIQITSSGEISMYGGDKIFRSSDDGASWSTQNLPSGITYYYTYLTPSGILFGFTNDSIYRSDNGGQSFTPMMVNKGSSIHHLTVLNSGRILLQTFNLSGTFNLLYSDNNGLSWQILTTPQQGAGGKFIPIAPLSDGTIFKDYLDGLHRSNDGGLTWQFSGTGIRTPIIEDMKFVSDSFYLALNRIGLWKTIDAGDHWDLLTYDFQENSINKKNFDLSPSGGVAVFQNNRLLWSSDYGDTFIDITPAGSVSSTFKNVFISPVDNTIFVNSDTNIKKSNNFGQTWTTVIVDNFLHNIAFHPSGRIIANCVWNIQISDNGGNTWSPMQHPPGWADSGPIASVAPDGTLYFSSENRNLWRSKDAGDTWTLLPSVLQNGIIGGESMAIASNGHLYLSDGYEDVLLSIDEGANWQTLPEKFTSQHVRNIALSPSQRLFASVTGFTPTLYRSVSPVTQGAYIKGYVKLDADAECSTPDAQFPLQNRIIKASSENLEYFTKTDVSGHYAFFVDTGSYEVIIQNPNGIWWAYCVDTHQVELPVLFATDTADFVALALSFCPLMTVNVAIPMLRRCFDNQVYVEYCNQGTEPADSAWVDVMLDPYLSYVNSLQPNIALPDNTYRFFVGDLQSGECGAFQLTVYANCDSTVLGQTHCVYAHGFPDTLCTTVPNWSGANIEAMVMCNDSTLKFNLKNTGTAPSQLLDFIIIVDDVVLMSGQENYGIAEDLVLEYPAEGSTWRIESEQEPGHPFSNLALAFAEGCGGFNSLGYINQFPVNGIQPSWHRICVENSGSFDPNDKQGFPSGVGSEHNIRPGQAIDYLIRFQNTGTDTAFTVVIRDTLSAFLDPVSFRAGASSHPYTWSLSGQGVINFTFNNIMLPDSNVNEPLSHGFVQFNIAPYFDVPLGSVIENNAAIYFDFNEPVITNTTWHTIQKSPLTSSFEPKPKSVTHGLEVWPNPFNERTNIRLEKKTSDTVLLKIFDSRGTPVAQKTATGPDIEFNARHLPTGMYWAEVRDMQGRLLGNGKLVKE